MDNDAAGEDIVIEIHREDVLFLVPVVLDQVEQVGGVHLTGVPGHFTGEVALADNGHSGPLCHLIGHGTLDIATGLGRHINDYGTGGHTLDHVLGHQYRRLAAKYLGGGDHHVGLGDQLLLRLALNFHLLRGQLPGITTGGFAGFAQVYFQELGTQ
jgi:hypothetical protein